MPQRKPHVAIIILNWNGFKDTRECLDSVFKIDYPNYSIYLIDNASENDELSELKKRYKSKGKIHFIQNSENLGFAEGNNIGIRKALDADSDYIFTLNNDTVLDSRAISAAIGCTFFSKADIIAFTMINYYHRTKLDNVGHNLLTTGDTVPRGRNQNPKNFNSTSTCFGACAGAALYSAPMLRKIGLFDPDFFLNYEDSDLSLRAIVRGYICVHCPEAIVYHKLNASISKIKNPLYRVRSQRNQLWAYFHNAPLLVILLNHPWIILRDIFVIFFSIVTFRWIIAYIFIASRVKVFLSIPKILKKRWKVQRKRKISSISFWFQQKTWPSTYWNYFKAIVIKRRNSVMD